MKYIETERDAEIADLRIRVNELEGLVLRVAGADDVSEGHRLILKEAVRIKACMRRHRSEDVR